MTHMAEGFSNAYEGLIESVAYVSFQELATRVSHRNTGTASGDPICEQLLAKVANDENLHMIFYRNLLNAAFDVAPNTTMRAITKVAKSFQMPGHTIENFGRKSVQIAMAGIYDLRLHHDDVLIPVLRQVKAFDRQLSGDGEAAREELSAYLTDLDAQASRFVERREVTRARQSARAAV